MKKSFATVNKNGILPMQNRQSTYDLEIPSDSGSREAIGGTTNHPAKERLSGRAKSEGIFYPPMITTTSRTNTVQAYADLRRRFPHALTKHQILYLIRQIMPGIENTHPLITAIHDSLDMAFENGFSQGRAGK